MSDFVWTLIAVRTLRILYTIQLVFIKKRCACVGRDKSGFLKDESRRDVCHFCVICRLVCLCLCGRARKGDIHLVTTKDRVGVSSHLTPLSCKPLDHFMGNGLAKTPLVSLIAIRRAESNR